MFYKNPVLKKRIHLTTAVNNTVQYNCHLHCKLPVIAEERFQLTMPVTSIYGHTN